MKNNLCKKMIFTFILTVGMLVIHLHFASKADAFVEVTNSYNDYLIHKQVYEEETGRSITFNLKPETFYIVYNDEDPTLCVINLPGVIQQRTDHWYERQIDEEAISPLLRNVSLVGKAYSVFYGKLTPSDFSIKVFYTGNIISAGAFTFNYTGDKSREEIFLYEFYYNSSESNSFVEVNETFNTYHETRLRVEVGEEVSLPLKQNTFYIVRDDDDPTLCGIALPSQISSHSNNWFLNNSASILFPKELGKIKLRGMAYSLFTETFYDAEVEYYGFYTGTIISQGNYNFKNLGQKEIDTLVLYEFYYDSSLADEEGPRIITEETNIIIDYDYPITLNQIKARFSAIDNKDGNVTSKIVFTTNYPSSGVVPVGQYYITATVEDIAGNIGTGTVSIHVVDIKVPTISLSATTKQIEVKTNYTLNDALSLFTVNDNVDGNITDTSKWTVSGNFDGNTNTVTSKTVVVNYTDKAGNVGVAKTLTIQIKDTTKPVISLSQSSITKEVKTTFTLENALSMFSVTDNYDTGLTDTKKWSISGTFEGNMNTLGTFTLVVTYKDANNNQGDSKTLTIRIVDTTLPVIIGDAEIESGVALSHDEIRALYSVSDNYDTISNSQIVIKSSNLIDRPGTYQIVLEVTDSSGNIGSKSITFELIDVDAPILYFQGGLSISQGTQLSLEQIKAFLLSTGQINPNSIDFKLEGSFDTTSEGDYILTLTEYFEDGTTETKTIKLNVFAPVEFEGTDNNQLIILPIISGVGLIGVMFFALKGIKKRKNKLGKV